MSKLTPDASVHIDHIMWTPWDEKRTMPFVATGATGQAQVKVLSRDPDTGAESLVYELEPGWSAASIENTVYENLLVLDGEIEVGDQTLRHHCFSYRPEGHTVGPVSTATGATVIAYAGAPGELSSKIPVPCIDVEAMPWTKRPLPNPASRYYVKPLRGDEENLDTYYMMRVVRGSSNSTKTAHDGPEEGFCLEGRNSQYDGPTDGMVYCTKGMYVHRGPWSWHGLVTTLEDEVFFKHDYFAPEEESSDLFLSSFPKETPALKALREGRVPELPKRW